MFQTTTVNQSLQSNTQAKVFIFYFFYNLWQAVNKQENNLPLPSLLRFDVGLRASADDPME